MTDKISRTSAATAARMRTSEDKMAAKLQERGWFCDRTGYPEGRFIPRSDIQLYATNGLRETYRVVGWTEDRLPLLQGRGEPFAGLQDYLFTVGPK